MSGKAVTVTTGARARKRVLFVCTENRVRSLTAHQIYSGRPDLEVQSAGISEYARVPLTQDMFEWADQVFVFSRRQQRALENRYQDSFRSKPVVCLHLADRFQFNRPKLVMKLTGKLGRYLGKPANGEKPADANALPPPIAQRPVFSRSPDTASLLRNVFSLFSSLGSGTRAVRAEPLA